MAAGLGHRRVVLDTNESLAGAIDRYNDNPYAHHWLAKTLPA